MPELVLRSHLAETAVGVTLPAWSRTQRFDVFWWRNKGFDVDFVISKGRKPTAIEMRSGRMEQMGGLEDFCRRYPETLLPAVGRNTLAEDFFGGNVPLLA